MVLGVYVETIDGLNQDEFFEKLKEQGIVKSTISGNLISYYASLDWIAETLEEILKGFLLGFPFRAEKNHLREYITRLYWVNMHNAAIRFSINRVRKKLMNNPDLERLAYAIKRLKEFSSLLSSESLYFETDDPIYSWLNEFDALFLSDYWSLCHEITNKQINDALKRACKK